MRHKVTARTEQLGRAFRRMSAEIEPDLHLVSQAARDEWQLLQLTWPTENQIREGAIALAEGELETIAAKVGRFQDILRSLAPSRCPELALADPE